MKTGDLKKGEGSPEEAPKSEIQVLTELVLTLQKKYDDLKVATAQSAPTNSEELVRALANFSAQQDNAKNLDYQAGIRVEDIPADDYDEEGVLFCAPFTGYVISDDRRKGHRVVLPYNKPSITFEFEGVKPIQEGKHIKLMNMCKYRSQSKLEIKWLREYTFFNTLIYESTRGVVNFDVLRAQKLAKIMTHISNFQMPQLINGCKEHNIPVSDDISVMRTTLAMKMADAELRRDKDSQGQRLIELEKEKSLLMQNRT